MAGLNLLYLLAPHAFPHTRYQPATFCRDRRTTVIAEQGTDAR